MPVRPFPHPISIGTDIAAISRIKKILSVEPCEKSLISILRRVLTRPERVQFWSRYAEYDLRQPKSSGVVSQFLTGRFAAKEAVIKAVLWRRLSFHDVIIRTPVFGEQMSAVILDRPLPERSPILHEVELLKQVEAGKWQHPQVRDFQGRRGDALDGVAGEGESAIAESETDSTAVLAEVATTGTAEDDIELFGAIAKISISHDGGYATAMCLAAEEPSEGDIGGEAAARGYNFESLSSDGSR